ncbi:MAG TPA: hypothetical protein VN616_13400 [Puia sp.]|nr:hypothetical protein [Puia sp.]
MPNRLLHVWTWGLLTLGASRLQAQVSYTLTYLDTTATLVGVVIEPAEPLRAPVELVMPRSVPGNYSVTKFDRFVVSPQAEDAAGHRRPMIASDLGAPRWTFADSDFLVRRIVYEIDCKRMDEELHAASDKSIIRPGFAGLLNYSVFGWIDGWDRQPVTCIIRTLPSWPVFSTLAPSATPVKGRLAFAAADYYALADAQTYLGPRFRVIEYPALVPLFIADFSEASQPDLDNFGWMESQGLRILKAYFGDLPFPCYTALFREAVRMPADDPGNFAEEHLQSSTFFGDTSRIVTTRQPDSLLWRRMASYLHHMSHAFIPLRCYSGAYRPYVPEIPPVINTIWFNEGFMWYLVADTLKEEGMMAGFRQTVYNGPPGIRKLTMQELSQIASTQYADDFRLGSAIFSRGALMAAEIDDYVRQRTGGKSSMRTIFRYLYEWSRKNSRPFTPGEFPGLLQAATGVNIRAIYDKWQGPIP